MQAQIAEKYLKTIYQIQPQGGRIKTSTLAQNLGGTAEPVTSMIKPLSAMRPMLDSHEVDKGKEILTWPTGSQN